MKNRKAFTLIELCVVIVIIAVLIVFILPALQNMHDPSPRIRCGNNLKQLAIGCLNYNDVYGVFPPSYVADADGNPLYSWRVLILPFIEQEDLYKKFRLDEAWDSDNNKALLEQIPWVYRCPESRSAPENASYAMIIGENTISSGAKATKIDEISDNHAQTILLVETRQEIPWSSPLDVSVESLEKGITVYGAPGASSDGIGSYHKRARGGAQVVFVDGSIRYLSPKNQAKVLKALATINGEEEIDMDDLSKP